MTDGDFYEADEPIEDIRAAYEAGEKGIMRSPSDHLAPRIVGRVIHQSESIDISGVIDSRHGAIIVGRTSNTFESNHLVKSVNTFTHNSVEDGTVKDGSTASITVA